MRAQRIKTGFRRAGIVGAAACTVPAAGALIYVLYVLITEGWGLRLDMLSAAQIAASWLIIAGAVYGASRTLGWIVASFAADDQISN